MHRYLDISEWEEEKLVQDLKYNENDLSTDILDFSKNKYDEDILFDDFLRSETKKENMQRGHNGYEYLVPRQGDIVDNFFIRIYSDPS